jgi:hypothetical protein
MHVVIFIEFITMDVEDDDWTPCSLCPLVMSPSVPAGMLIGVGC